MKKSVLRIVLLFTALAMLATACGGSDDSGAIEIQNARYRLARADLGAGYMMISNTTDTDVTLQAASAEGVGRVEIHESILGDDGVMAMEARPEGFLIAAGQSITLEPGGKHLMIFDPVGTDDRTFTLDFGDETIDVVLTYDAEASAAAASDMADMGMDMDADHSGDDAMGEMEDSGDDAMGDMEDADS